MNLFNHFPVFIQQFEVFKFIKLAKVAHGIKCQNGFGIFQRGIQHGQLIKLHDISHEIHRLRLCGSQLSEFVNKVDLNLFFAGKGTRDALLIEVFDQPQTIGEIIRAGNCFLAVDGNLDVIGITFAHLFTVHGKGDERLLCPESVVPGKQVKTAVKRKTLIFESLFYISIIYFKIPLTEFIGGKSFGGEFIFYQTRITKKFHSGKVGHIRKIVILQVKVLKSLKRFNTLKIFKIVVAYI